MKILGIGNAIVDVICKVNDEFIINNNLTKSNMKLIFDENKTSIEQIASNVTDVGHDTKSFIASSEAYESLAPCCKYRDQRVVEDHK